MGIFTRLRDIISANLNSMLDKAEDPEKMIRLMIQEMEDTLVEIKASCASAMAEAKKIEREMELASAHVASWQSKAQLAVDKGREDLAREALLAKRQAGVRVEGLERELAESQSLVGQYQADIMQLEEKLATVREMKRMLVQRHIHAAQRRRAQDDIRRAESNDLVARFEAMRSKVERMEAEADLVNLGAKSTLADEFERLEGDEEIERELAALKSKNA